MDPFRHLFQSRDELERLFRPVDSFDPTRYGIQQRMLSDLDSLSRYAADLAPHWEQAATYAPDHSLDAYAHALRDDPAFLMGLRAERLHMSELAQAAAWIPKDYSSAPASSTAQEHLETLSRIAEQATLASAASERIYDHIGQSTRDGIAEFSKPYRDIHDQFQRQIDSMAAIADTADWARRLGIQTIDPASISAAARLWGTDDTLRTIGELAGVDRHALRLVAAALEAASFQDVEFGEDEDAYESRNEARHGVRLSVSDVIAILSVLLMLVIWHHQHKASVASEERLRAEIRDVSEQTHTQQSMDAQAEHFSRLAEALIQQAQTGDSVQFVARSRGAVIRNEKSGGTVVAHALPGQVVTLIAKEGKWIEISYFDFATRELQAGWALKKHFVRTQPDQPASEERE